MLALPNDQTRVPIQEIAWIRRIPTFKQWPGFLCRWERALQQFAQAARILFAT